MLFTDRQTNQHCQKHNLLCQGGKNASGVKSRTGTFVCQGVHDPFLFEKKKKVPSPEPETFLKTPN